MNSENQILNFFQYHMVIYIIQAFIILSQPTGGLVELLRSMQADATLLRVVRQQSCICLNGPKSLTVFTLYATSTTTANIVVVPCKRT